jgi:hypothetical protein
MNYLVSSELNILNTFAICNKTKVTDLTLGHDEVE